MWKGGTKLDFPSLSLLLSEIQLGSISRRRQKRTLGEDSECNGLLNSLSPCSMFPIRVQKRLQQDPTLNFLYYPPKKLLDIFTYSAKHNAPIAPGFLPQEFRKIYAKFSLGFQNFRCN
jgi:hypothetical protein